MARRGDQVRNSDVTFWGVLALVIWAVAVLAANISAFVPENILGGLHASRLDGGTLNQLRTSVASLQSESARLRQENTVLLQRFVLAEQSTGDVTRRVGALELSIPHLLEAGAAENAIDRGAVTASTATSPATSFEADGGSVSYTTTPLSDPGVRTAAPAPQPMPQRLDQARPDSSAFGIALGPPIDADEGERAWQNMNAKVGTLLVGLAPLLANVEASSGKKLVAGPIATEAEARQLCGHMAKIGIACSSVPFIGVPLPLLN